VVFDASASLFEGTAAEFAFDFGDGTAPVTPHS
jgi:hypothetical protein